MLPSLQQVCNEELMMPNALAKIDGLPKLRDFQNGEPVMNQVFEVDIQNKPLPLTVKVFTSAGRRVGRVLSDPYESEPTRFSMPEGRMISHFWQTGRKSPHNITASAQRKLQLVFGLPTRGRKRSAPASRSADAVPAKRVPVPRVRYRPHSKATRESVEGESEESEGEVKALKSRISELTRVNAEVQLENQEKDRQIAQLTQRAEVARRALLAVVDY